MSFRDGRPPFDGGPPPPPPPGVEWGPDSFCEAVATCDLELVQALLGSCSVSAACVSTQPISTLSGHDFEANTPALHVGITLAAMHLSGDYDSELESSSRLTDFDSSLHADMIRALAFQGANWAAVDAGGRDVYTLLSDLSKPGAFDEQGGLTRLLSSGRGGLASFCDKLRQEYDVRGERLQAAAERSQVPQLRSAMRDVTVDYQEVDGLTALHWAVVKGNVEAAEVLLAAGASTTLVDKWGMTALHAIVDSRRAGSPGTGDNVPVGGRQHAFSFEPALAPGSRHELLELFVSFGASLDVQDGKGRSVLHYATSGEQADHVHTAVGLILNGCSAETLDSDGKRPVDGIPADMETACTLAVERRSVEASLQDGAEQGMPKGQRSSKGRAGRGRGRARVVPFPRPKPEPEPESEPEPEQEPKQAPPAEDTEAMLRTAMLTRILVVTQEMEEKGLTHAMLSSEGEDVSAMAADIDVLRKELNALKLQQRSSATQAATTFVSKDQGFKWCPASPDSTDNESEYDDDELMTDLITPLNTSWEELQEEERQAATTLQWSEQTWTNDNTRIVDRTWGELTEEELEACEVLEIVEDDWEDLNLAEDEPEPEEPAPDAPTKDAKDVRRDRVRHTEILNDEQLLVWRDTMIGEIAEFLGISRVVASKLLHRHGYDMEHIRANVAPSWFSGEQAAILEAIGEAASEAVSVPGQSADGTVECGVCFDDCRPEKITANRCGHTFCNECWAGHLSFSIGEGKTVIGCMEDGCSSTLEQQTVVVLAPPSVAAKFSRFSAKNFVQSHGSLKGCCNPKCELTIKMHAAGQTEVCCDPSLGGCDTVNCAETGCGVEAHFPCACNMVSKWMAKCDSDGGLFSWIAENSIAGNGQNTDGIKPW